jgi:hypothetical protein
MTEHRAASDGGEPGTVDPRIQDGIDHLQRAAREVIAASRALLDVAEELVEDPNAAGNVGRFVASLAGQAQRWVGSSVRPDPTGPDGPDGNSPVQRIPVS